MHRQPDDPGVEPGDEKRRDNRLLYAIVGGLVVVSVGCFAWAAWGHDHKGMVFDPWCCNGNSTTGDCQEIPRQSVKAVDGGYQVTLSPGQHSKVVKSTHTYFVEQSKVRDSTNGLYYACIYPREDTLRCFYAPPPGA